MMATVGSLGSVTFNVSSRRVLTFDNYKRSGGASVTEHDIIASKSKLEFTGLKPEQITLDVQLVAQLSISPESILAKLRKMRDTGEVVNFLLGGAPVSNNKWLLTSLDETTVNWKRHGKFLVANASLTIQEYVIDEVASDSKSTPWGHIVTGKQIGRAHV